MIWTKPYRLDDLTRIMTGDHMVGYVGLEFTEIGDDFVKARLPVDHRTRQVHGILHGGATAMLAETVGSVASLMCIDSDRQTAVGSMITANHIRPARSGYVTAVCRPVHLGRTKHVWDIQVHDEATKLIAKCELTCAVIDRTPQGLDVAPQSDLA